jgi:hypothetical protein
VRVLVIPADEPPYLHDMEHTLEAMQGLVGGYIECVQLPRGLGDLWLNENGKFECLDEEGRVIINTFATCLAEAVLFRGDFIAGDAFLAGHDGQGETTPVSDLTVEVVSQLYGVPISAREMLTNSGEETIQFGVLHEDGTLTDERFIKRSDIGACPQYILVPEHYREDGSCRCDEGHYDDEGEWIEVPLAEYLSTRSGEEE